MEVILDMVISTNGFIARENGEEDWLPDVGWYECIAGAEKYNNIVMGHKTYELIAGKEAAEDFNNAQIDYKLIVTNNQGFKAPSGYVVVHSPHEAMEYLDSKGAKTLFLIGGSKLNAAFAKQGLISQVQLTVTPYIIGKGRPLLAFENFEFGMTLLDIKKLSLGRVRLVYKVSS